jgi:hypothetical protein
MEYFDDTQWIEEKYGQKFCNSGGADGADTVWENECMINGIPVIAWSFNNHKTKSKNRKILTTEELKEGWEKVVIANETLKRNIWGLKPYVKNLLARNWFQVKNSEAVFAVAHLDSSFKFILGGTGWCCMMGIDNNKPVYVFDSNFNSWFEFSYINYKFQKIDYIPELTETFAGVGSREIDDHGINAIKEIFQIK